MRLLCFALLCCAFVGCEVPVSRARGLVRQAKCEAHGSGWRFVLDTLPPLDAGDDIDEFIPARRCVHVDSTLEVTVKW